MNNLVYNIPVYSDKIREEIGMWEYIFKTPLTNREFNEEELK